jgi:hypothetical protein
MREETELLVAHVLRDNRPATELLVGRQTFLHEPLAGFYGIPDVEGPEMRLVSLADDSHRGGLLTHGSLLAVTSNPTRTSPVKRGQFILDNLLGTPAPPPPPDVPSLEAVARTSGRKPTMRELMEVHRQDALCASCHARMDPLGLALEHYNALGQWRGADAVGIDTSGRLITGEAFADAVPAVAGPMHKHPFLAPGWGEVAQTRTGRALFDAYLSPSALREAGVFRPSVLGALRCTWHRLPRAANARRVLDLLLGSALGVQVLHAQFIARLPDSNADFPLQLRQLR